MGGVLLGPKPKEERGVAEYAGRLCSRNDNPVIRLAVLPTSRVVLEGARWPWSSFDRPRISEQGSDVEGQEESVAEPVMDAPERGWTAFEAEPDRDGNPGRVQERDDGYAQDGELGYRRQAGPHVEVHQAEET